MVVVNVQGLVVPVAGGVKILGNDGVDGVGKGKNGSPVPVEGVALYGGNVGNGGDCSVGNGGDCSVGNGKVLPMLGNPGMFKRRRAMAASML